MPVPEK